LAGFFLLTIFRCKNCRHEKISSLFSFSLLVCLFSNCGDYYYFQNNKTIEITIANKKGKETGKLVYTISDVAKKGGATVSHHSTQKCLIKTEKVLRRQPIIGAV
jgi:hypothetical protein